MTDDHTTDTLQDAVTDFVKHMKRADACEFAITALTKTLSERSRELEGKDELTLQDLFGYLDMSNAVQIAQLTELSQLLRAQLTASIVHHKCEGHGPSATIHRVGRKAQEGEVEEYDAAVAKFKETGDDGPLVEFMKKLTGLTDISGVEMTPDGEGFYAKIGDTHTSEEIKSILQDVNDFMEGTQKE